MTPVGTIFQYAGNSAPSGWLLCQGQLLSILSYPNLYTVVGTTYGGDGVTQFALPDLSGRVPLGSGGGYSLGSTGGSSTHTLTVDQMPSHNHTGTINEVSDHTHTYQDAYFAENRGSGTGIYGTSSATDTDNQFIYRTADGSWSTNPSNLTSGSNGGHTHTMSNSFTGGSSSFSIMQPYITLSYIIKY
jgi:microcystin-dependent protein